jgi:aldose 1-epimerase
VVYTPPGESFFCAEPVSHITDAFNLAATGQADTGMLTLAPGESVRASLTLTPEIT